MTMNFFRPDSETAHEISYTGGWIRGLERDDQAIVNLTFSARGLDGDQQELVLAILRTIEIE